MITMPTGFLLSAAWTLNSACMEAYRQVPWVLPDPVGNGSATEALPPASVALLMIKRWNSSAISRCTALNAGGVGMLRVSDQCLRIRTEKSCGDTRASSCEPTVVCIELILDK